MKKFVDLQSGDTVWIFNRQNHQFSETAVVSSKLVSGLSGRFLIKTTDGLDFIVEPGDSKVSTQTYICCSDRTRLFEYVWRLIRWKDREEDGDPGEILRIAQELLKYEEDIR